MRKNDESSYLGNGLNFPLKTDARGQLLLVTGSEDIEQAIRIILETYPGERVMRPDFGCRARDLLFAPRSAETLTLLRGYVEEALALWEPRIRVSDVDCDYADTVDGGIVCTIEYEILSTHDERSIVYPFYIEPEPEIR